MSRIIYLSPSDDKPTGGIKVIYRHAELLSKLGADAFVLHPFDVDFKCSWFDHDVRFLKDLALEKDDFIILPEIYAGVFGPQCQQPGIRYAIFVQNGYITQPLAPQIRPEDVLSAYKHAASILVISEDTAEMVALNYPFLARHRIHSVQYSIHERFLTGGALLDSKERIITYMPRKMASHAAHVVFALHQHLPAGWQIQAIDGVDEDTCSLMLARSKIFLSFSAFEGLPLPPLEAALSGNLVVGYTGQGAREYWISPNFEEIHQGDIRGFVGATLRAIHRMDNHDLTPADLKPGIRDLTHRYSVSAETACIERLWQAIKGLPAPPNVEHDQLCLAQ